MIMHYRKNCSDRNMVYIYIITYIYLSTLYIYIAIVLVCHGITKYHPNKSWKIDATISQATFLHLHACSDRRVLDLHRSAHLDDFKFNLWLCKLTVNASRSFANK